MEDILTQLYLHAYISAYFSWVPIILILWYFDIDIKCSWLNNMRSAARSFYEKKKKIYLMIRLMN